MVTYQRVSLDDILVMFASEQGEPGSSASRAFERLETALPSLRGRRFYGVFDPETTEYRACVALQEGDDPETLDLRRWTIPGGAYLRSRLRGPHAETAPKIAATFAELASSGAADRSRPAIEFYRSETEILILLPIT